MGAADPIDDALARAAEAWPGVRIAPERFAAFVAERGAVARPDLVLACAWCNSSRRARSPAIHALVMCGLKRVGRHPCFPA